MGNSLIPVGNGDAGEQIELSALLPALLVATRRGSRLPSASTVSKSRAVQSVFELVLKPEGSQQSLSPSQPLVHTQGVCTVAPTHILTAFTVTPCAL